MKLGTNAFGRLKCDGLTYRCKYCLEAFNSGSPELAESVRRELYMIRYQTRDLREYRGAIRTLELIWGDS